MSAKLTDTQLVGAAAQRKTVASSPTETLKGGASRKSRRS